MVKNKIGIGTLILAMLFVSIVFVPAVSAQADISQNEKNDNTIETSNKKSISEEEIKNISENANVLRETDNEKVVSVKKNDGSIGYTISWIDEKNPKKIDFAFVDQKELVSKKLVSATTLSDNAAVANAVSLAKKSFWHGSYIEKYGTSTTGGVHIYFSNRDADWVVDVGSGAAGAIGAIIGSFFTPAASSILALLLALGVQTVYWQEQNSNGSLDVRIPYANIASMLITHSIYVKIGTHWHWI